ncbi:hypothetical protein GJV44_00444 [Candidatus Vallotia cooleyia]|nr:hypothetical protein GJV44_00444 [Candidatus Vallotia cooleyia]
MPNVERVSDIQINRMTVQLFPYCNELLTII